MSLLSRVANVFRPGRAHAELDEELEFHVEERTRELIADGMPPFHARAAARRQFGNRLQIREASYDVKAIIWLESIFRDIGLSLRLLRKERTVTAAAILSLSLALGVCTAAFSLIDRLILRPLPIARPHELVQVAYAGTARPGSSGVPEDEERFSYPALERFRQAAASEVDLFGVTLSAGFQSATFPGSDEEHPVRAESLSGNGFDVLGLKPAAGRLFSPADDHVGEGPAPAILSHAFWIRQFAGSSAAIGQWITLGGKPVQIVGVVQPDFSGLQPGYLTDIWVPLLTTANAGRRADPQDEWLQIWGRMRNGRPESMARQPLQAAFTNLRRERASAGAAFRDLPLRLREAATGRASLFRQQFKRPLWILALISLLILAIACSNVANLLIARGSARGREMALRIAIGAGRVRLVQQLLVESALLAGLACVLALVFAAYAAPLVVSQLGPSDFPAYLDVGIDARVFGFAVLCAAATSLAFGLIPALRVSAVSPNLALKGDDGKQPARTGTLRAVLSVQVAFSIAVLFLSGLLVTSFRKLMHVDLGFAKDRVILFDVVGRGPSDAEAQRAICRQLVDRLRATPGVEASALSGMALMGGAFAPHIAPRIRMPGRDWERVRPFYMAVSPGFFQTMQMRLLGGRDFEFADAAARQGTPVVVNQAFVKQYFPGQDAVGRQMEQLTDDPKPAAIRIVGVVADARYNDLRETIAPTIYTPLLTVGGRSGATLEVRTAGDPRGLIGALRKDIELSNPSLKVTRATLQSTRIDDTVLSDRLLAVLGGLFAAIALLLVSVGLYGVIRYAASRRRKEVGIRIALGAPRPAVLRLMWRDVALPVAVGLLTGILGGALAARFLEAILYDVKPTDAASLAIPVLCIILTSVAAALPPAMRASRTDPMAVLRHE